MANNDNTIDYGDKEKAISPVPEEWYPGIYQVDIEKAKFNIDYVTCAFAYVDLTMADEVEVMELSLTKPVVFHDLSPLGDVLQVNLPVYATRLIRKAKESLAHIQEADF